MDLLTVVHTNDGVLSLMQRKGTMPLFLHFLRIGTKSVFLPKSKTDRFLGYKVNVFDYRSFAMLFLEVFMKEDYKVKLDREDPNIIDCGSNIGMSILYFKKEYPNAKIWGFEPLPENYNILEENIKQNNLNDVVLSPFAVGNKTEMVKLYSTDNKSNISSLGASTLKTSGVETPINVMQVKLSLLIKTIGTVDLLKLDIEGSEWNVIMELCKSKEIKRVKNIICEYHFNSDNQERLLDIFLKTLRDNGFIYDITIRNGINNVVRARRKK